MWVRAIASWSWFSMASLKSTMYENMDILRKETDNRLKVYAEIMTNPEKKRQFEEFKEMFFETR